MENGVSRKLFCKSPGELFLKLRVHEPGRASSKPTCHKEPTLSQAVKESLHLRYLLER